MGEVWSHGRGSLCTEVMDKHGVRHIEDFTITADGACPADRPKDQKKNKKFKPSCKDVTAATITPSRSQRSGFHAGRRPSSRRPSASEYRDFVFEHLRGVFFADQYCSKHEFPGHCLTNWPAQ